MRDLRRVCREFGIGRLVEVEDLLGGGYINGNLKIRTTKGHFVVRIFLKEVAEERLKYACSIVSKLVEEGVPALLPLLNSEGVTHTRYKEFVVQITPFVEASRFQWIPEQAYYCGKTLRRMHDTLIGMENSPKPRAFITIINLIPQP